LLYAKLHRRYGPVRPAGRRREATRARLASLDASLGGLLESPPRAGSRGSVVVVGAGFAGLSAAYFLSLLGFEATVVEARDRVGGRVETLAGFAPGRLIEAGAELIGLNHPLWIWLARRFGLAFSVVTPEADFEGLGLEMPLVLGGRRVPPEEAEALWADLDKAFASLAADAKRVFTKGLTPYEPWLVKDAEALDRRPLSAWKDGLKLSPLAKAAIEAEVANNNVEPTRKQSYLANLALVAGGGFDDFWADTEVFRCATGNQSLAEALRRELERPRHGRAGRVLLGRPVSEVALEERGVRVRAGRETLAADYAVLAVPPSAWDGIRVDPPLPKRYRMQVGPAVKWLSLVSERFWLREGLAPYGTDDRIGETWEGTDNQLVAEGQGLELTLFAGGDAARRALRQQRPADWYTANLEQLLPGYRRHRGRTRFVRWPDEPWTRGGYSCPAPGQVTAVAPLLSRPCHERLVFAGEHACPAFFGYMEGALQSGLLAVGRIAEAEGLFAWREAVDALWAADRATWARIAAAS
jgi:monoamine oxidase